MSANSLAGDSGLGKNPCSAPATLDPEQPRAALALDQARRGTAGQCSRNSLGGLQSPGAMHSEFLLRDYTGTIHFSLLHSQTPGPAPRLEQVPELWSTALGAPPFHWATVENHSTKIKAFWWLLFLKASNDWTRLPHITFCAWKHITGPFQANQHFLSSWALVLPDTLVTFRVTRNGSHKVGCSSSPAPSPSLTLCRGPPWLFSDLLCTWE